MKKEKKTDYDLNMNDYIQIYDHNLTTLRLITQPWPEYLLIRNEMKQMCSPYWSPTAS